MTDALNATHDPGRKSWVESANDPGAEFPIQNLPFGVFHRRDDDGRERRIGVAIGDRILDVRKAIGLGTLNDLSAAAASALGASTLNELMSRGAGTWSEVRAAIAGVLDADTPANHDLLVAPDDVVMHLPAVIGDYTDFYASVHHATNIGSMFRPDNPLLPNYKNLPVGYHGRASSIVISGSEVRRPKGQLKPKDDEPPIFDDCRLLDYELEMGFFVGPGNQLGERITMDRASENIFGMCIVNDWSARDVQKWEYQPLGPFNAKNFCTSISPWVVTLEALAPYRIPGPPRGDDDPAMLDYLQPVHDMGFDITVEVLLASAKMREKGTDPHRVSRGNFREMFWTIEQMLVHHTSTGCNTRPGDLMASGTISGPEDDARGCMLELTWRGENPIKLPDGTERKFLQDGDEVIIRAGAEKDGAARVGFGECRGVITSAK